MCIEPLSPTATITNTPCAALHCSSSLLAALLGLDLPEVELELLSLQDVAVGASALPGAGGDGGQHAAGHELVLEGLLNLEERQGFVRITELFILH